MTEEEGLHYLSNMCFEPAEIDKNGPNYSRSAIEAYILNEITINSESNLITRKVKSMSSKIKEALDVMECSIVKVSELNDRLLNSEKSVAESSKKAVSKVKSSVNEITDSVAKIEKIANFDKLERYSKTLLDIAGSLERISLLQNDGRLDSVIKALSSK